MMFSTKAEYGVRVMTHLARHDGPSPVSLAELSEAVARYWQGWGADLAGWKKDPPPLDQLRAIVALVNSRGRALRGSDIEVLGFGFGWLSNTWTITFTFALLSIAPITRPPTTKRRMSRPRHGASSSRSGSRRGDS